MDLYYSNNVILALGLACLAGLGYMFWSMNKKYPNLKKGEIMSALAVDEHETFFILFILLLGLGDGISAASAHPEGQQLQNPLARIILHVGMFGVESIASVTVVRDIASCFIKQEWRYRIWKIVGTLLVLAVAVGLPYLTLSLTASGLDADFAFDMWKYSIDPRISWDEYQSVVDQYGLAADGRPYRAYDHLPLQLKLGIGSAVVRALLLAIEGVRNVASPTRSRLLFKRLEDEIKEEEARLKGEKEEAKKGDPASDTGDASGKSKEVPKNARFLLSRLEYSGSKLDGFVSEAEKAIDRIKDETEKGTMSARMAQLVSRANQIKTITNADDKKAKNAELKKDIIKFFSGKVIVDVDKRPAGVKQADYLKEAGLGLQVKGS